MYLISPHKKQYKANLHSHSTISDGKRTPRELKEMYKNHGYSILAITDHEVPKNHSYLNDDDFLTITGYEAYIRPRADYRLDRHGKETHMNLFARQPDNETMICYHAAGCKYMTPEEQAGCKKAGTENDREYSVEYVNRFVRTARENGYLVAYNHPFLSMEEETDVLAYEGFFSMEMCNYGSYQFSRLEYNAPLYDKMLKLGKRIFCHSADDNHNHVPDDSPRCDSFGGFTMILPETFTYDGIIKAMEQGEMYSSMGPLFHEISVEGNMVHVECSEVERITLFTGTKTPKRVFADVGKTITCADLEIEADAEFLRVSIVDSRGRYADTRGFFMKELGL